MATRAMAVPWWSLCTLLGLAAPLLKLIGARGFCVHGLGPTSIGKTHGLAFAASIFGSPDSYPRSWAATDRGLEGQAEAHCDLVLCLDEMGLVRPGALSTLAYMLADGRGRSRMKADASMRPLKHWRTVVVSTGEQGMEAKLVEDQRGRLAGGQAVRFIELELPKAGLAVRLGQGQVRDAERARRSQYGTAGPEFIRGLLSVDDEDLVKRLDSIEEELLRVGEERAGKLGAPHERVARCFAVTELAGLLAVEWSVLPEDFPVEPVVRKAWTAWLGDANERVDDVRQAAARLLELIENRQGQTIVPMFDSEGGTSAADLGRAHGTRDGWYEMDKRGEVFLADSTLKEALRGYGPGGSRGCDNFARAAAEKGALLLPPKEGETQRLKCRTPRSWGWNQRRHYLFDLDGLRAWAKPDAIGGLE